MSEITISNTDKPKSVILSRHMKLTAEPIENKNRQISYETCRFLAVGYRKDVFMFFVDRVELSEFLMKSFALLTMKSKPTVLMKFSATQKMKLNPPIAAAISYAESVFHIAKQYFTHPQGWI